MTTTRSGTIDGARIALGVRLEARRVARSLWRRAAWRQENAYDMFEWEVNRE